MSDVSLIEYLPFAVVGYSAIVVLLVSIIHDAPMTRSLSIVRSVYILLGMICVFAISGMGINFHGLTNIDIINATEFNVTTGAKISEVITNSTSTEKYTMLNYPLWVIAHRMFGIVMAFYFILQIVTLLTKKD